MSPPVTWTSAPTEPIQNFEIRHENPLSFALFASAARAVESLHYLDDIDRAFDGSHTAIGGHNQGVVDVAHAGWAASTCITALDLCAAGLGRAFCDHKKAKELDLAHFCSQPSKGKDWRALLPQPAQQWVDAVCADPEYKAVKAARDWLVHSCVKRHLTLADGGPHQRLELELPATRLGVRQLVEGARDVATRHVSVFLEMLPRI